MKLFDERNVAGDVGTREFRALKDFLSFPLQSPRPSVWRLKHCLAIENANVLTIAPEIPEIAIAREYGFTRS